LQKAQDQYGGINMPNDIVEERSSFLLFLDVLRGDSISEADKGTLFEKTCKKILEESPFFGPDVQKVWRWSDWPGRGNLHDIGIDIVVQKTNGKWAAVQCKFYQPTSSIKKPGLDSFLSAGAREYMDSRTGEPIRFDELYIFATTNSMDENARATCVNHVPSVIFFGPDDLAECGIDWSTFKLDDVDALRSLPKKIIRPHQIEALNDVMHGFENHDRGKLIMACGTGKTFTSLRIVEQYVKEKDIRGANILYLVPSIALLAQTVLEWKVQFDLPSGNDMFAICSDVTAAGATRNSEREDGDLTNIPIPATTNAGAVKKSYTKIKDDGKVHFFFSTYQSIDVIHEVAKECGIVFDMVVCDEAHRTIGAYLGSSETKEDRSDFIKVHDNEYIPAKKRLYMTATEKIFGTGAKEKAANAGYEVYSMDDETVFGPRFHLLSFGTAVSKDLLADYRLIVLQIKESQVTSLFQPGVGGTIDQNARIIGSLSALSKKTLREDNTDFSYDPEPMRRAVVFCSRIQEAKDVSAIYNELPTDAMLGKEFFERNGYTIPVTDHISGQDNSEQKTRKLNWLRADVEDGTCRMLTNARCLSEGVDVPALDAIIFMAKKRSQVDIIQAVGRIMRKPGKGSTKKYGYIILPVVIQDQSLTDKTLDNNEDFKVVWKVIQALRSHDERMDSAVNSYEYTEKLPPNIIVTDAFVAPRPERVVDDQSRQKSGVDRTDEIEGIDTDAPVTTHVQMSLLPPDPEEIKKNEALFGASLIKHCGNRLYWDDWSKQVGDVTNHMAIVIKKLVSGPDANPSAKREFAKFLKGARDLLNPYVSEDDGIAMLAEHLVTLPVFNALFGNNDFIGQNVITQIMQGMIDKLRDYGLRNETKDLNDFYEAVADQVKEVKDSASRQKLVKKVYEKFFQYALPAAQTKFGIVYTPNEIVDFIINSVDDVLRREFKLNLASKGVKILDPFTGTGTFIVRLLDKLMADGISRDDFKHKYQYDIWCNEIMLLSYYVASINIESSYLGYMDEYLPFEHAILTDTFQLAEKKKGKLYQGKTWGVDQVFGRAVERIKEEDDSDIRVIIANPPYSVGQRSANENNQNDSYEALDKRIADTYLKGVRVTNVNSIYDSYVRAFRWASDRVSENGVIGFVSNGSFIDNLAFGGFRAALVSEFESVYAFNLRGNQRTQGELSRREGGKIFGSGSRNTICITILVKKQGAQKDGYIHYFAVDDYLTREDKLALVEKKGSIKKVEWEKIKPDQNNDWLNKKDDHFSDFVLLGDKKTGAASVFAGFYSRGIATGKDAWLYGYDLSAIKVRISKYITTYTEEVARVLPIIRKRQTKNLSLEQLFMDEAITDSARIKWDREMVKKAIHLKPLEQSEVAYIKAAFRPFVAMNMAFYPEMIQMNYLWKNLLPSIDAENLFIATSYSPITRGFCALMTNNLVDLHFCENTQVFPRYWYEEKTGQLTLFDFEDEAAQYRRRDSISEEVLDEFRQVYHDASITKDDIFYYIYGVFHSKTFKEKYSNNLSKEFPRVPYLEGFYQYVKAGRALAELHLHYEEAEPYEGVTIKKSSEDYTVEKIKLVSKDDKTKIRFNSAIEISNIPLRAYEYVVNGRSPLEWVMDQYQYSVDGDSGIVNDPNKYSSKGGKYVFDLILSLITVSLKTLDIVDGLPEYRELVKMKQMSLLTDDNK
jgi:predicted helicase